MTQLDVYFREQSGGYPIYIQPGALGRNVRELLPKKKYNKIVVLTDTNLSERLLPEVFRQLPEDSHFAIKLPPGEAAKTMESVQKVWSELVHIGAGRDTLLINLGGGVIGDLGGFAASTYYRGIDFIQVPTTLLAQVDASVGGKLGVDFAGLKNSIGSIAQPAAVICDPRILTSLPRRELISGFAEVLKHGAIADTAYFALASRRRVTEYSEEELTGIIRRSCEIKLSVVQQDEHESGIRKILNFGHTFGHALESLSFDGSDPITHGEAVSLGMCFEAFLSNRLGLLPSEDLLQLTEALRLQDLPTCFAGQSKVNQEIWTCEALVKRMKGDKKNRDGKILWSLIDKLGSCRFDVEVSHGEVLAAFESFAIKARR